MAVQKKKRMFIEANEAVVALDAKPLESFTDALSAAVGLPTSVEKVTAADHFNEAFLTTPTFQTLPLTALVESETNPRKTFTGLDELADSMRKVGVLVPIIVRKVADTSTWEIIAGHRRFRAAKLAELDEVPVDVRQLTDVQVLEVQLVENIQRSDLTQLEEAAGYRALMERAGYTADQVAAKAGKSRGWVYARLKLLDLCSELQEAVVTGKLSSSVAVGVARIPTAKEQLKAFERIEGLPAREAFEALQRGFTVSLKGAPFNRKDSMLLDGAPACTVCPKRSGSATPGVFDDISGADVCTDTKCFAAKCRANWDEKSSKLASAGAEVLGIDEGRKLFKHDNVLSYPAKYVESDVPAPDDAKKRTWEQLLEKVPDEDRPKLYIAPDTTMAVRRMYVHADILHAIAKHHGLMWAERQVQKGKERAKVDDPIELASEEAARAIRDKVVRLVVGMAAAHVKKEGLSFPWVRLLARTVEGDGGDLFLEECTDTPVTEKEKWLGIAGEKDLLAFIAASVLHEAVKNTWQGFEEELQSIASLLGINLDELVKLEMEVK